MANSDPENELPEDAEPEQTGPVPVPDEDSQAENNAEAGDTTQEPAQIKIAALEAELDQAKDQMLRALADADNTRKRAQKERVDTSRYAISAFAKNLLDFADNFRRAIDTLPDELVESDDEHIKSILSGLEAMDRELFSTFTKHGITKLEPMDEPFDPNFHEVMFETPSKDKETGTIVKIIDPGYMLHDRLLRPARVGVAKNDADQGNQGDAGHRVDREV